MSVDGIGGSTYENRRRVLEEERAKELDRIEKRFKDQVGKAEEAREQRLKEIYESQNDQVEAKRQDASERIGQVKDEADKNIRDFQVEAFHLTEQAKRQYQAKAKLLEKSAKEIDEQRKFMVKRHEDSMRDLTKTHEENYLKNKVDNERDIKRQYTDLKYRTQKVEDQGEADIQQVRMEAAERVRQERADGDRKIYQLGEEQKISQASLDARVNAVRQQANSQLAEVKVENQSKQEKLISEHQSQVLDSTQRAKAEMARVQRSNRYAVDAEQERGLKEQALIERANKKQVGELNNQNAKTIESIQTEARLRQYDAEKNSQNFRAEQEMKRVKMREDAAKANLETKERVKKETQLQAEQLHEKRKEDISRMNSEIQDSLRFIKDRGDSQIRQKLESKMEQIDAHGKRQSDTFYHVQAFAPSVSESSNEIVVEVNVPEHEQDRVRLSYNRDHLMLSGTRRAENTIDSKDGRKVRTNSYQSYSETIPVQGHVDMGKMTRNYENGRIKFRVPKG